jgi:uncharacterized protein (TIGR03790 family)
MKRITVSLLGLLLPVLAAAEGLEPSQVLILGNHQNEASRHLAHFYARQRNIPPKNILLLDLPDSEDISRVQYDRELAQPLRQFLHQLKLENTVKALVTIYGVPLKVGPAEPDAVQRATARQVKARFDDACKILEATYPAVEKLAQTSTTQSTRLIGPPDIDQFMAHASTIDSRLQYLYNAIFARFKKTKDPAERQKLSQQFLQLRMTLEGQMQIAEMTKNQPGENLERLSRLRRERAEFEAMQATAPELRDLDKFYDLARELGGILLEMKLVHDDYQRLMQKNSMAAVDSELALVLWENYALAGKIPNALNPRLSSNPLVQDRPPVLMVSRLDGPSPQIVERMITNAVETQRKGLQGTFYIDARGLGEKNGYFEYDEDLRNLAAAVKRRTKMPVVLDNRPEVFPPGACPNTALYCGWYSLRNYVPAFSFVPGAIGYHIASFEAVTLHHPKTNIWVKRMLDEGITATLGPVEEPLLEAFPLPSEFFGLLLTGKYTLAEVYFRTNRYNSWRMILIGDPLYNPFAGKPLLDEKDIPLRPLGLILLN